MFKCHIFCHVFFWCASSDICVCVCLYVYIYVYIYIYMYTCTYMIYTHSACTCRCLLWDLRASACVHCTYLSKLTHHMCIHDICTPYLSAEPSARPFFKFPRHGNWACVGRGWCVPGGGCNVNAIPRRSHPTLMKSPQGGLLARGSRQAFWGFSVPSLSRFFFGNRVCFAVFYRRNIRELLRSRGFFTNEPRGTNPRLRITDVRHGPHPVLPWTI